MSDEIQNKLREIAESIFEITCYMFPVEPEEFGDEKQAEQLDLKQTKSAIVTFKGAATGAMVISANDYLFEAIAANMLGVDETNDKEKEAALCEIANIICGNTVPIFANDGNICYIDPPKSYKHDSNQLVSYKDFHHSELTLYLDEGVSQISIYYKVG